MLAKRMFICFSLIVCNTAMSCTAAPFTMNELTAVKQNLFANITTNTHTASKQEKNTLLHSLPGAVIASPSNKEAHFSQDYQFHWTRDAAITMNEVAYLYSQAAGDEKQQLKNYLWNYIYFEKHAQQQISKPGEQTLGQPKFNIDASIWEGQWMRPQNDGPALRAMTMTHIARLFMQENNTSLLANLTSIISTDLNYVTSEWKNTSYDLWEEVNDKDHFFNKMVQRKAFIEAAELFKQLGKEQQANAYLHTAKQITQSLQQHWDTAHGYLTETIHQQDFKGGGIDSSIIFGVLYGNIQDSNDDFAINSDKVLRSVYAIRQAFSKIYKINTDHPKQPPLIGRYPSDKYDGDQFIYGNPWVISTNGLAQYYYELADFYLQQGKIKITQDNKLFFQQLGLPLLQGETTITAKGNKQQFDALINRLIATGDTLLERVKNYSVCYSDHTCYHLAEQIDRNSGQQTSAKDLTWGYTSILTAIQARPRQTGIGMTRI